MEDTKRDETKRREERVIDHWEIGEMTCLRCTQCAPVCVRACVCVCVCVKLKEEEQTDAKGEKPAERTEERRET